MGIVAVLLTGLVKLWLTNRYMRKVERLDAEVQERVTQMRKSGMPTNGRVQVSSEITFGVKALESGVEVDEIWIATQVSLASQPPNRKWSSRRKTRTPSSLLEMSGLISPRRTGRTGSRAARQAGKICAKGIVDLAPQQRNTSNNTSLLEGADPQEETVHGGQFPPVDRRHSLALCRIQRGMQRMKSETWHDQDRKRTSGTVGGTLGAQELNEQAQAKKSHRLYPRNRKSTLMAPTARSPTTERRLSDLLHAYGASGPAVQLPTEERSQSRHAGKSQASGAQSQVSPVVSYRSSDARQAQKYKPQQQVSGYARTPSVGASVNTTKELAALVQVPGPLPRRSSEDRAILRQTPEIPMRMSSRGSRYRQSTGDGRNIAEPPSHTTNVPPSPAGQLSRYPPNSSRSGPVIQQSQSSGHGPSSGEVCVEPWRSSLSSQTDKCSKVRRSMSSPVERRPRPIRAATI